MLQCKKAIRAILNFKKDLQSVDDYLSKRLIGRIAGELGELYVFTELEKRGYKPKLKGGQGGWDIDVPAENRRIEVKTSNLKNEGLFNKKVEFWGWSVKRKGQKIKFDTLICVRLDNKWRRPRFYIFSKNEASHSNIHFGRFSNNEKGIIMFKNSRSYKIAMKEKPDIRENWCIAQLNASPAKFENRWKKIKRSSN